jgi:hypothetical protein
MEKKEQIGEKSVKNYIKSIREEMTNLLSDSLIKTYKPFILEDLLHEIENHKKAMCEIANKRNNSKVMELVARKNYFYFNDLGDALTKMPISEHSRIVNIKNIATLVFDTSKKKKEISEEEEFDESDDEKDNTKRHPNKDDFKAFVEEIMKGSYPEEVSIYIKTEDVQKLSFKFIDATYDDLKWIEKHLIKNFGVEAKDIFFVFDLSKLSELKREKKHADICRLIDLDEMNSYNVVIKSVEGNHKQNRTKIIDLKFKIEDSESESDSDKKCKIKVNDVINIGCYKYCHFQINKFNLMRDNNKLEKKLTYIGRYGPQPPFVSPFPIDWNKEEDEIKFDRDSFISNWIDSNPPKSGDNIESKTLYLKSLNDKLKEHNQEEINHAKFNVIMKNKGYIDKRYHAKNKDFVYWSR